MAESTTSNDLNGVAAELARRSNWDPTWNGQDLGLQDEVYPNFKFELSPITTGTTGKKLILGHRYEGVSGMIKVQMRQISKAQFKALTPWSSDTNPSVTPPLNADLYQYAQELVLHPHDRPGDTTEDLVFWKAVPTSPPGTIKRDGSKDDVWEVEFAIYPDRAKLKADPTNAAIGQVGR